MRRLLPAASAALMSACSALAADILSARTRTEPAVPYVGEDFRLVLEVTAAPGSEIQLTGIAGVRLTEDLKHPVVTQQLTVFVLGLIQSVSINEQSSALDAADLPTLERHSWHQPDRYVMTHLEEVATTVAYIDDGQVMSGIAIVKMACVEV